MSIKVKLHEEETVLAALASLKDDSTDTDWVILTHHNDDPNTLGLQATGTDGLTGLKNALTAEKVQYAMLRLSIKVDLSNTVKFVYIYNIGDKVPFVKKGRFGIVKGDATKYFQPHHIDFEISSPDELDEEVIVKKLQDAAGTADHLIQSTEGKQERSFPGSRPANVRSVTAAFSASSLQDAPAPVVSSAPAPVKSPFFNTAQSSNANITPAPVGPRPSVNLSSGTLTFDDAFVEAIADVRNDKSETKWVLGAYKDANINQPIILVGSGSDSIDELVALLEDGMIAYGLFRVVDMIDGHETIKFALIVFVGPGVSAMKKAKIVSHRGAVTTKLAPFHVELTAYDKSEVTYEEILSKVQASSGSKSFVM